MKTGSAGNRMVVIGAQAGGMSAASTVRRIDPRIDVLVLEKGPFVSYGTCSIPYYISDDIKNYRDLLAITPEEVEQRGITVRTGWEAVEIKPGEKVVIVADRERKAREAVAFEKLVIATGAFPIRPPIPGADLKNIFTLRTLEDGIAVRTQIDEWAARPDTGRKGREAPLNAVIVGGGYVGLELCEAFRRRGVAVTLVEKMDRVLGTMDTSITQLVEDELTQQGVRLFKETEVLAIEGIGGYARSVVTDRGTFDAQMIVLAVGIAPVSDLAASAGIETGIRRAITVDPHMRTSVTDIYAAGDCADAISVVTGKKTYIPLGTTANKQGRVAGENIAGRETVFDGIAGTVQTKVFDLEVARTGLSSLDAEREGLNCFASTIQGQSRAKPYPFGKPIFITYTVERGSGRLLGAQMVGREGVAHRIDTLATCLYGKMTIEDVARLDLGYAPPFATVWDPILIAANVALKKMGKR